MMGRSVRACLLLTNNIWIIPSNKLGRSERERKTPHLYIDEKEELAASRELWIKKNEEEHERIKLDTGLHYILRKDIYVDRVAAIYQKIKREEIYIQRERERIEESRTTRHTCSVHHSRRRTKKGMEMREIEDRLIDLHSRISREKVVCSSRIEQGKVKISGAFGCTS